MVLCRNLNNLPVGQCPFLAADQGDAHAQNNLGIAYFHGLGVDQNDGEAVR